MYTNQIKHRINHTNESRHRREHFYWKYGNTSTSPYYQETDSYVHYSSFSEDLRTTQVRGISLTSDLKEGSQADETFSQHGLNLSYIKNIRKIEGDHPLGMPP